MTTMSVGDTWRAGDDRERSNSEQTRALCTLSARIGRIRTRDGARWLGELCECVRESFSSHVGVVSAVRMRHEDDPSRSIECVARSSGYDAVFDEHIERLRTNQGGMPRWFFPGMPESVRRSRDPLVLSRSEMISDAKWRESSLHNERTRLGLHEFAWSACRVDGSGPARTLMIQLDGLTRSWSLDPEGAAMLSVAAEVAQAQYAEGPLADLARRGALLDELSPMRRRVAPLLATGMSEAEIAAKLGRSRHTVHEHAKAVYQQWGVSSRHELRTLWLGLTDEPDVIDETDRPEPGPEGGSRSAFAPAPSPAGVITPTRPTGRATGSAPGAPPRARRIL